MSAAREFDGGIETVAPEAAAVADAYGHVWSVPGAVSQVGYQTRTGAAPLDAKATPVGCRNRKPNQAVTKPIIAARKVAVEIAMTPSSAPCGFGPSWPHGLRMVTRSAVTLNTV